MVLLASSFLASAFAVGAVTWALDRWQVVDVPNHRSSHDRPVPRGGGLVLVPCVALALSLAGDWAPTLVLVVGAAAVLGAVGFADDVRGLPAAQRLILQLLVSAAVAWGLVRLEVSGALVTVLALGVTALWLTGFVNAFNFMDGANGVAGVQTLVAGGWAVWVAGAYGGETVGHLGLALLGVAAGFLPWNLPRARVFLGDVGSYSLGLLLGALAVMALLETGSLIAAVAPLTVFLFDTLFTLLRRSFTGQPVMTAHREHVYQQLTSRPGSVIPAATTGAASLFCVLAAALAPAAWCLLGWAAVLAVYLALPCILRGRRRPAAG